MANVIQASTKSPDIALANFIKNLDIFIQQSTMNLQKMKNKQAQMATFWKGDQYNRFSVIMEKTIKDAAKELLEMRRLKEDLIKKLAELRAGMRH